MPNVEVVGKSKISATAALATPAGKKPIIHQIEVDSAVLAILEYQETGRKHREAEKARDAALMVVFEKALGVKTLEAVKALDIPAMNALLELRKNSFKTEAAFKFKHDGQKVNPKWKDEFIAALGEAKAAEVTAKTKPSHTWHIIPE